MRKHKLSAPSACCDDPKWFFVNNAGNPEPIWIKLYTVMVAEMVRFPGNSRCPQSRAAKIDQKKVNFFDRYTTPPKYHFSVVSLFSSGR